MYTALPASLTVLSDNRLLFFKSSVISPNKQSQNANLSRVFTQIQFGLLRKLFREIQARAGLGVYNFKV